MKAGLALVLSAVLVVSAISFLAAAKPKGEWTLQSSVNLHPVFSIVEPSGGHAVVTVPVHALEVAPGVFYLGTAVHEGKAVQGFAFVNYGKGYREKYAKPGTECGNGVCEPGENANKCPADCGGGGSEESTCYSFLSKGAKWRSVEGYLVNANNTEGLNSSFVMSTMEAGIGKWEAEAGTDILGDGSQTGDELAADMQSPDGRNEVYFGDVSGAVAVTVIWGVFTGPPSQRELTEWDQVYDQKDYDWGSSGEADRMDFENVATHELGHSTGMDHPNDSCTEETMYRFVDYGETKKRTLEAGDKTGIRELYA